MDSDTVLEIRGGAFGYGEPGHKKYILRGIDMTVGSGDFLLFKGNNGSGKTTLIRGILGLTSIREGEIQIRVPKARIGYVPQESGLEADIPACALDVVRTGAPASWRESSVYALSLLQKVGLDEKAEQRFGTLSGGQRRRVLVARALARNPQLLVLDEPTANVDAETKAVLERLLSALASEAGVAIIVCTHAVDWAAGAKNYRVEGGALHG